MRLQPNRNYVSDDVVQTPPKLARQLVEHFQPSGRILEPCKGSGNFLRALRAFVRGQKSLVISQKSLSNGQGSAARKPTLNPEPSAMRTPGLALSSQPSALDVHRKTLSSVSWCEIQAGRDFFVWTEKVDWIITNPPWSQIRAFLQHAMKVADNVVFLLTINHVWTKARLRDVREAGFGLREIVLVDMPASFPQSGFQLGAVHISRGWRGSISLSEILTSSDQNVRN